MLARLAVCLIACAAGSAPGRPFSPEDLELYRDACERQCTEYIAMLKRGVDEGVLQLRESRRRNLLPEYLQQLRLDIPRVRKRIQELERSPDSFVPKFNGPLEPGLVGMLETRFHVRQVIGPRELLADVNLSIRSWRITDLVETRTVAAWMENIDTEGITDGVGLELAGPYVVEGTKQYTTVLGGTKTVYRFRKLDLGPHAPNLHEPQKKTTRGAGASGRR